MPRPKRGPKRPLTPEDLRDALAETSRDIVGHLTRTQAVYAEKVDKRFDRLEQEMRDGFQQMNIRLDGTLQLFPTRKELHTVPQRLSRILRAHGIRVEPEALLRK